MENKETFYIILFESLIIKFKLTLSEYYILQKINILSYSKKYDFSCSMSKVNLGKTIGISRTQVHRIINSLIDKDLLIRDEKTKYLHATDIWIKALEDEKGKLKKDDKK